MLRLGKFFFLLSLTLRASHNPKTPFFVLIGGGHFPGNSPGLPRPLIQPLWSTSPNWQNDVVPGSFYYRGGTVVSPNALFHNAFRHTVVLSTPPGNVSPNYSGYLPVNHDAGFANGLSSNHGSSVSTSFLPASLNCGVGMISNHVVGFDHGFDQLPLSSSSGMLNNWHSARELSSAPVTIPEDEFLGGISCHSMQQMHSLMATTTNTSDFSTHRARISSGAFYNTGDTQSDFGTQNPHIDNPPAYNSSPNPLISARNTVLAQQAVDASSTFPCQYGCNRVFVRSADLDRHNSTVHGINRGTHLCPVSNCIKSQGSGYSRADKLKEHMWKKHADLGHVKGR
jgi:hypothetical protein